MLNNCRLLSLGNVITKLHPPAPLLLFSYLLPAHGPPVFLAASGPLHRQFPWQESPTHHLTLINSSFSTLVPTGFLAFNPGSGTQLALQKRTRLAESRAGPRLPFPRPHPTILGKRRPRKGQQQQSPLVTRQVPGSSRGGRGSHRFLLPNPSPQGGLAAEAGPRPN